MRAKIVQREARYFIDIGKKEVIKPTVKRLCNILFKVLELCAVHFKVILETFHVQTSITLLIVLRTQNKI